MQGHKIAKLKFMGPRPKIYISMPMYKNSFFKPNTFRHLPPTRWPFGSHIDTLHRNESDTTYDRKKTTK
jgi:hypothetical protein